MQLHRFVVAVGFSTVFLGAGRASADAPSWCGNADLRRMTGGDLATAQKEADAGSALYKLVALSCKPGGDNPRDIAALRAAWSKRLDLSESDWADVATWSSAELVVRSNPSIKVDGKKALRDMTPLDQFAAIYDNDEFVYLADALEGRLAEAGRLGYVLSCARAQNPVHWAVCQPDIDALDRAKLAAEIRADTTHTPTERTAMRIMAYAAAGRLAKHAEKVAAITAKDRAYKALFETAVEGRKVKPNPALLALALEVDDARITQSRRASEGCEAKTDAALTGAISGIPAAKFENLRDNKEGGPEILTQILSILIADPNSYLAALSYYNCRSANRSTGDYISRKVADSLARWPGFRGPRGAAYTALLNKHEQPDDRSDKISIPSPNHSWMRNSGGGSMGGDGVVASVNVNGAEVVATFVPQLVTISKCTGWVPTNVIDGIYPDGRLSYEHRCTGRAPTQINLASKPQTLRSAFAGGVKPGALLWARGEAALVVWSTPGKKTPDFILGAPVK